MTRDDAIERIALDLLGLETLQTRKRDRLDFHDPPFLAFVTDGPLVCVDAGNPTCLNSIVSSFPPSPLSSPSRRRRSLRAKPVRCPQPCDANPA